MKINTYNRKPANISSMANTGGRLFITLVVAMLFLISFASAQVEADYTMRYNQPSILKNPCFANGTYCQNTASCYITITDPNHNNVKVNQLMEVGADNYPNWATNLTSVHNAQFGFFKSIMKCTDNTVSGSQTFYYEVTADGKPSQKLPYQLLVLAFGLVVALLGMKFEKFMIIKYIGALILMIEGILTLYPGYSYINYSTLEGLTIGTIAMALGFFFLLADFFSFDKQDDHYHQYEEDDD